MRITLGLVFLSAVLDGQPAFAQQATPEDFKELATAVTGDHNLLNAASSRQAVLDVGPMFTTITNAPMLTNTGPFETSFWVDYDNDDFLDLFLTGGKESDEGASGFKNALYHNNGDGTFAKISDGAILTQTKNAGSQTWGDYDNDGFMDVFIAQWGGSRKGVLLHNSGNGAFTPVLTNQPISQGNGPTAVWSDFNNDGFLDLSHQAAGRNTILRGADDGNFTGPLMLDTAGGWNRAAADYDNDGLVDLVINTAPEGRHVLYRNAGNGTFQRVISGDIAKQAAGFFGMAWGDYDNDGFLDLFAARGPNGNTVLFHNERDGTLREVSDSGIIVTTAGWNPHWVDFDNDGYLDLFVTGDLGVASSLYRNNGDATFAKVTTGSIATDIQANPYGSAWGDYDHNGFMDLFVPNQDGPHHLYRNNGNGNAWIQFKLVGTASNRAGIGAKVRVRAGINGKDLWQLRELIATEGFDGPGTLRAEFGLGNAAKVDVVRIEWPSGTVQEFRDVAPRQLLTITEPSRLTAAKRNADGSAQFNLIGAVGVPFRVESSPDLMNWTTLTTITNRTRTEVIIDSNPASATRFYRAIGPGPIPFPR